MRRFSSGINSISSRVSSTLAVAATCSPRTSTLGWREVFKCSSRSVTGTPARLVNPSSRRCLKGLRFRVGWKNRRNATNATTRPTQIAPAIVSHRSHGCQVKGFPFGRWLSQASWWLR